MRQYIEAVVAVLSTNDVLVETKPDGKRLVKLVDGTADGTEITEEQKSEIDALWLSDEYQNPAPSTNPNDYPLNAFEFDAALVRLGIDPDAIKPALYEVITDDIDLLADAVARWRNLVTVTRDNEIMAMLKPVFDVTDAQIDAAWMATVTRRPA